jgi:transcriptional regulator with XRE-family HTH domain
VAITYAELLEQQGPNRSGFGRMLLNWRRRNGWTQYTACSWAEEAGFETISYGNLSVIEQGKAGELRQKAFWQLAELNRRIAEQEWGTVKSQAIKQKLEGAIPLGDGDCPIWTALELWACYCGLRQVPAAFLATPPPTIGQRKATELSAKWRQQLRRVVEEWALDPSEAITTLAAAASEDHRKRFYAVLTGFGDYKPDELAPLWIGTDQYLPKRWLDQWEDSNRQGRQPGGSKGKKPTAPK